MVEKPEEGTADQNRLERITYKEGMWNNTHPGGRAQDGGEGAPLHQLAQSGGGVKRADCRRPRRRRRHRVRVLFPELLSGSRGSTLQQTGGAVEPGAQSSGLKSEAFRGCGLPERTWD